MNDSTEMKNQRILTYLKNVLSDMMEHSTQNEVARYFDFYSDSNSILQSIFSLFHYQLNDLFEYLNKRIRTGHFTADESRDLIDLIGEIESLQRNVQNTKFSFKINENYQNRINECKQFLQASGGSPIPEELNTNHILEMEPVFISESTIDVKRGNEKLPFSINLIGEGSYAKVFKYNDSFYNRTFALKRALHSLNDIERKRFIKEFQVMKELNSPYVIEVFSLNEEKLEYVMEYADLTIEKYIKKNNSKISLPERINLINQVFRAFIYINKKGILHRDISITNVLLKVYDDLKVVKLSDFGLVKDGKHNYTKSNTEFKGSLNDPQLETIGFRHYEVRHETYALTRLVYFILTGKMILSKFENAEVNKFFRTGMDNDINNRFKSAEDQKNAFNSIAKYLK